MGPAEFLMLFLVIGDVIVIAIVVFFLNRYYTERLKRERQDQADTMIVSAKENAKTIELEAKDNAMKVLRDAEDEISRRRNENIKEEERLNKRRNEIDNRIERLELRDQTINKRQSLVDKRANEIEKMYAQQLGEGTNRRGWPGCARIHGGEISCLGYCGERRCICHSQV